MLLLYLSLKYSFVQNYFDVKMPLSEAQKNAAPFKTVDIKSLFLAASNRKRKASSSIASSTETKSVKLCEKESDPDVEVLDVIENSHIISIGDSKENKDLNAVEIESKSSVNETTPSKEGDIDNVNKCHSSPMSCEDDSKGSSEDLNSSALNSSLLAPNTSDLSENDNDNTETTVANSETVKSETKSNVQQKMLNNATNPKKRKRMTPEEAQQRAIEREQKQQERLRKKQELEAKRLKREEEIKQRKLAKEMEKKAKEEEKKEKERLRLEKKQQEEKEKEAQKMLRQMQMAQKLELKKQKEEMKQKQEEERKRAEEERKKADLEKEEKEKLKKERAKAAFAKFFVKEKAVPLPPQKIEQEEGFFKPFQISEDMTLAPVVPSIALERFNRDELDAALKSQDCKVLYLQILKSGNYCDVRFRKKQRKPKLCDADVIIANNNEVSLHLTAKLLQFSENVRPPYWGTWRKKSRNIRPRNPLGQDEMFDYSVDSDDEWDEGGPGESLSGTEPEDESEDDYEVDNEFFVPHGYLSAEEEKEDDEEEKDVITDPEKQKALLKKKQQEFEMERRKKTTELKPIILGCYIENTDTPQNKELRTLLEPYAAVLLTENTIPTFFTVKKLQSESKPNSAASSPLNVTNTNAKKVPEEAMPHLIRLIHGNSHGRAILIPEFQKFWKQHCKSLDQSEKPSDENKATDLLDQGTSVSDSAVSSSFISKRQLFLTMKQIATKRSTEATKNLVWWVNDNVREKYGLNDMPLPNTWNYLTTVSKEKIGGEEMQEEEKTKKASPVVKQNNLSIKEFLAP